MKTYSRQPEAKSDTAQPKASRQASAHDVLQAYKDRTVQRQEIDEDELLQGQFSDTAQLLQDEGSKLLERGNEDKLRQKLAEELKIKDKGHSRHKGSYDPEGDSPEKILTNLTYPCFDPPAKYAEGEAVIQREEIDEEELLQGKFDTPATQREEIPSEGGETNLTGMPDNLKSGIESLSGYSMDDVRVHYNSSKPAQLQALAYAQGTDIHIAPGQEQHLPHEAWHVVQQKQGRVQPTTQLQGVNVNDNEGLEKEADVMGGKAVQSVNLKNNSLEKIESSSLSNTQFMVDEYGQNPNCFDQMMHGFQYGSIKQALGYRTIARAFVNGISLGMSYSDKAPDGESDHAEDAVIETIQIILDWNRDYAVSCGINGDIYDQIHAELSKGKRELYLDISASPCRRCTETIWEFAQQYNFEIKLNFHHYYRDPQGGIVTSKDGIKTLQEKDITADLDPEVIQRMLIGEDF
jgi:hypothetical protein